MVLLCIMPEQDVGGVQGILAVAEAEAKRGVGANYEEIK